MENPDPDMTLNYMDPIDPPPMMNFGGSTFEIDIRKTVIVDSENTDRSSTLDTIYKHINEDGDLVIDVDSAKYGNDDHPEGETFDYKYDEDGEKFGAGTAFLKD